MSAAATVRKDGAWWVIEREGKFLQRARSKKRATLTARLLDGDLTAAPDWYRATIAEHRRVHNDPIGGAILAAQMFGLTPADVRADKQGNPLD